MKNFFKAVNGFVPVMSIVVPLYFFLLISILSLFWPGYEFVSEYISILGSSGSPFKFIVNVFGFVVLGVAIIIFSRELSDDVDDSIFSRTAFRLMVFTGLVIVLLGIFPADRSILMPTPDGEMHRALSAMAFIATPFGMLLYAFAFLHDSRWGNFWSGVSFTLAFLSLLSVAMLRTGLNQYYGGSIERMGLGMFLIWLFLIAWNLFFLNKFKQWAKLG